MAAAAAAAAPATLLLVDACTDDVDNPPADKPDDVDVPADDIAKSGVDTPAAAAAANAFNNFKSFLRADDDADPLGSTHITYVDVWFFCVWLDLRASLFKFLWYTN